MHRQKNDVLRGRRAVFRSGLQWLGNRAFRVCQGVPRLQSLTTMLAGIVPLRASSLRGRCG